MTDTMIVNMMLDRFEEHLTQKMITDLDEDDPRRVNKIKKGLFQENPTVISKHIHLAIQGGNHEKPDLQDGIFSLDKHPNLAFVGAVREIGGGVLWERYISIEIGCFYIQKNLPEDDAHEQAYNILGLLLNNIENVNFSQMYDTYGEHPVEVFCLANTFFESGGPPDKYIFRGRIEIIVITERP